MTRCLALAFTVLWLFGSSCSDSSPILPDGPVLAADQGAPAEMGRDGSVDRGTDQGPVPDSAAKASFCGTLLDPGQAPVAKGDIIICNDSTCYSGTASSAGTFCVSVDAVGDYLFHSTEKQANGKHYADVFFPLSLSASELDSRATIELGDIIQPLIEKAVALDPVAGGLLDLGGGVTLTVGPNSASLPPLASSASVGVAAVPLNQINQRLLASRPGSPAPVMAVALVPYEVGFAPPATLKAPTSISASSATLDAFHADSKTGVLTAAGQASVVNGTLSLELSELGWYLLYPP